MFKFHSYCNSIRPTTWRDPQSSQLRLLWTCQPQPTHQVTTEAYMNLNKISWSWHRQQNPSSWSYPNVTPQNSAINCLLLLLLFSCSVMPNFCDPMDWSKPGFPVLHHLPEFAQTHVHWVGDAIQPSQPLPPTSPALNLSQHLSLFQWVGSSHQVELQHQSF